MGTSHAVISQFNKSREQFKLVSKDDQKYAIENIRPVA